MCFSDYLIVLQCRGPAFLIRCENSNEVCCEDIVCTEKEPTVIMYA